MAIKPASGKVSIIDKATQPLRSIANAFKNLGTSSKTANKDLTATQKAIKSVSAAQNQLNRTSQNMQNSTKNIGSQAVGVVALGLSFKQALQPAIQFEQSMKDLEAVAFGAADSSVPVAKNMALLSKQAKDLGASTSFSASEAASAQIFLAKAGFKTNEILSAMTPLLDLAAASGTDLGRASDITSDLLGAFGMKASETGKLADVLAAATSSANVDMETLFESLKVAAPIGVAAGQSMEGMVSATALLGNVGIKGSNAGTALKNALTNLASPASTGSKILKELGITVEDANGKMLPLQEIMGNLGKEAKNLSQAKQIKVFSGIFGKEAMAGAINLEKAINSGDFSKMLVNLQNSEGVASKMAKIRMDSTEGSFKQLASATEGAAITFGTMLSPAIRTAAEILTKATGALQNFIQNNQEVVKIIGFVVGAIFAFKLAALAVTGAIWLLAPAVKALSFSLGILKGALTVVNFLMKASPIGMLLTLGAVAVAIAMNWEKVTETFKGLWEVIKNFNFSDIMGSFSKIKDFLGFGGDTEVKKEQNTFLSQSPQVQAQTQAIANNNNNTANITVNVEDGKVKSVENKGNFKSNTYLNPGVQN